MRSVLFSCSLFMVLSTVNAQIPVGQWRTHLSYSQGICVEPASNRIYCLTEGGLFCYNLSDNSMTKLDKTKGLSDVTVNSIKYISDKDVLVIGYDNGNLDLIKGNQIINVSDIKQKPIIGKKAINSITYINHQVYLGCGFGIVLLDVDNAEITDSYFIGTNASNVDIHSITLSSDSIYASSTEGIYKASLNANLANFQNWSKILNIHNYNKSFSHVVYFSGALFAAYSSGTWNSDVVYINKNGSWNVYDTLIKNVSNMDISKGKLLITDFSKAYIIADAESPMQSFWEQDVSPADAKLDDNSCLWIADKNLGLVWRGVSDWKCNSVKPNGPAHIDCMRLACAENEVWVTRGGLTSSLNNQWKNCELYRFTSENWLNYSYLNENVFGNICDVCTVKINPTNSKQIYFGSFGGGLIEFNNGTFSVINETNSPLQNIFPGQPYNRVTGLDFDKDGNLWVINSEVQNNLTVRKANGDWKSFSLTNAMGGTKITDELYCSSNGIKWIIFPKGGGFFAFSDNGTIDNTSDDKMQKLQVTSSDGEVISNDIYCIKEDKDGLLWFGTANGLVYYSNSEQVFDNTGFYAQRIKLPNGIPGQANYLFESVTITALAIDGANRKWVGTLSGGVFLMSSDCTKEIYHFTIDNSPLLSNSIYDISIEPNTGEVFIATDKGVCSYRGTATEGLDYNHNVEVFPNPVKETYSGPICIRGLVKNAHVKITDIAGSLVFETQAEGGQANWDGKNAQGKRVCTGIYLVFSTNDDGSETFVTKMLFIN
jgi:hypothetical protein